MLYTRTLVTMFVSLFTVRVVFNALGEVDYGIQNVISGFVLMLSFISGSLSVAFSRFFSIELGKKDYERLRATFANSLSISLILAICLTIVIEACGLLFLKYKMNMPVDREFAANVTFQFSVAILFVNTVSIPYDALIISREKMSAYAYISILDVALKLIIAICLIFSDFDKLILYSILLFIQSLIIRMVYSKYCSSKFPESRVRFAGDKEILKQIGAMAGWDLWGSSSYVLKNYGVNLFINVYCGVAVNAARAIAMQVNSAVSKFSSGFLTALRPQITMAYVSKDREYLFTLADMGTKFSCYLMILLSAPMIAESHYILSLWLGSVPDYAVDFTNLILICTISEGTLVYCHNAVIMANGNIRNVQLVTGSIQLLNLPICWWLLSQGYSPIYTVVTAILISQLTCFIRILFLRRLTGYSLRNFILKVYCPIILVLAAGVFASEIPHVFMHEGLPRLIISCLTGMAITLSAVFSIGCTRYERAILIAKISNIYRRLTHNK